MARSDVASYIREHKRSTKSVEEQIAIAYAMRDSDIDPDDDGLKASEIEDEFGLDLDYRPKTSLKHLEDISIVEEYLPPGPKTLVIAEWMDGGHGEVVNGEVMEAAKEGLDALVDDLEDSPPDSGAATVADGSGTTVRSVVAAEFDLVPDKVEEFLQTTSNPVDVLNGAVDAIENNDGVEVGENYGEIAFINRAYRYRLTEMTVNLYER